MQQRYLTPMDGRTRTDGSRMDRWAEGREGDADDDALLVRPTDVRPTDFHSLRGIFQSLNRKERSMDYGLWTTGRDSQRTNVKV